MYQFVGISVRRKIGAIAITAIILILALTYVTTPPSHSTPLDGIPISDSVFVELVKPESDPVVYPQYPVVESTASITMKFDYSGFEKVNESVALSSSIEFISQIWYLSEFNFSIDTGWTNLDDVSWHFRFRDESVDVYSYVVVNAISGKVSYFSSVWPIGESPFLPNTSESQFANSSELEQLAITFFHQFNYSLSPHARYVGPNLRYNYAFHHIVFVISFTNVVNETLIDGRVNLYLDVEANAVLGFSYSWVHVDAIPKESIISPEQAKQFVRNHFKETINMSPFVIRSVTLLFDRISTGFGGIYRLGWIVSIDNEFVVRAKVDAKSGIIYDTGYRISADSVDVVVVTCI